MEDSDYKQAYSDGYKAYGEDICYPQQRGASYFIVWWDGWRQAQFDDIDREISEMF